MPEQANPLSCHELAGLPSAARPFVEALGTTDAVEFLLNFGGQVINIPARPAGKSALTRAIGGTRVAALRQVIGHGKIRVPVVRRWLAQRLDADGVERPEIAKRLRVTRESVRTYLARPKAEASTCP